MSCASCNGIFKYHSIKFVIIIIFFFIIIIFFIIIFIIIFIIFSKSRYFTNKFNIKFNKLNNHINRI